ncbi:hypothetical protein MRQ36_16090 [Micromonospora sp. R77]|uniref:hypothetical protein n=1 Tax=Micromonospora sp. R77 TaxID=2925836 RepID=UPI001F60F2FC|nr:hypothetical protein [Micromonospora sp. R77]MCI4064033.1 hypothetical protein [Micromonospora sp. R77]
MSEYYTIIVDAGHELAASARNLGALSSNTFNAARSLGRVDLLSADAEIAKLLAQSKLKGVIIGAVATGGIIAVATGGIIAAVKSAPYVKGWFNDLKSKSSGNSEMSEGESQPALDGTAATNFSQQVEASLDDLRTDMSSEEAQRRLAMIMIAAAFIADQIRTLSRARVEDADAPPELKSALERLSALDLTDTLNRMLEANSSLLSDETTAALMKIFEGGRFVEGEYLPLRNDKIKDALRLTDGEE